MNVKKQINFFPTSKSTVQQILELKNEDAYKEHVICMGDHRIFFCSNIIKYMQQHCLILHRDRQNDQSRRKNNINLKGENNNNNNKPKEQCI